MCTQILEALRRVRGNYKRLEATQMKLANSLKDIIYESHSVRN